MKRKAGLVSFHRKRSKRAVAFFLLSSFLLSSCQKDNKDISLGEIQLSSTSSEESPPSGEASGEAVHVTENRSMKDEEKVLFGTQGIVNDGGAVSDEEGSLSFLPEVRSFVATDETIYYKDMTGNLFLYNGKTGTSKLEQKSEAYEPYKLGSLGTTIARIENRGAGYLISSEGTSREISTEKLVISADNKNAYLFDSGSLFLMDLETGTEKKITVKLNGEPAVIQKILDRYKNDSLMLHVGNTGYLVKLEALRNLTDDSFDLLPDFTVNISDIAEILQSGERNDYGSFVYLSTNGNIKVYNKNQNKVACEIPNVIQNRKSDVTDAFAIYEPNGKNVAVYFTNLYRTFRFKTGNKQLFEVKQEPLSRFEIFSNGILFRSGNKIQYHYRLVL